MIGEGNRFTRSQLRQVNHDMFSSTNNNVKISRASSKPYVEPKYPTIPISCNSKRVIRDTVDPSYSNWFGIHLAKQLQYVLSYYWTIASSSSFHPTCLATSERRDEPAPPAIRFTGGVGTSPPSPVRFAHQHRKRAWSWACLQITSVCAALFGLV